jgi:hypothetical protein
MAEIMENLEAVALLVAIFSVAFSFLAFPLTGGKIDPWLFLRPMVRSLRRGLGKGLHTVAATFNGWAKSAWRQAKNPRRVGLDRFALAIVAVLCGATSIVFAIPANIIGSGKKK